MLQSLTLFAVAAPCFDWASPTVTHYSDVIPRPRIPLSFPHYHVYNLVIRCDRASRGQRSLAPEENWWSRAREPSLDGRSFELCKRSVHTYHRQIIYARTDDPDVYSISEHMFSFGPVTGSPPPVIISPSIIDYCIVHVSLRHHFPKCHCDNSQPPPPPVRPSHSLRLLCIVSAHTVFHCYASSSRSG